LTNFRRLFAGGFALASGTLAMLAACHVSDVDFDGKACPCGEGYVCDQTTNTCVRPGTVGTPVAEGGPIVGNDDGSPGTTACGGDNCPCSTDEDCSDPDRAHCSPGKICVECVATADTCRAGTYCNGSNECTLGCKQESDCVASPLSPHCDVTRHQCVACRTLADCTGADQCSPAGECVQGCDLDAGKLCSGAKQCCNKLCIDVTTDPLNCGGCGVACSLANGTPACAANKCSWTCASGYAHCGTGNTGCETNTRTTIAHCGSCTTDCSATVANATGIVCTAGACSYGSCTMGFADCDGQKANGCECTCGAARGQNCCPGGVCNFPGGTCNGANKCI
jgi:hypothetical protein